MTEAPLLVRFKATGLYTVQSYSRTMYKRLSLVTRGVMYNNTGRPINLTLASLQKAPVHLLKAISILIAAEAPTSMLDSDSRCKYSRIEKTTGSFKGVYFAPIEPPPRARSAPD